MQNSCFVFPKSRLKILQKSMDKSKREYSDLEDIFSLDWDSECTFDISQIDYIDLSLEDNELNNAILLDESDSKSDSKSESDELNSHEFLPVLNMLEECAICFTENVPPENIFQLECCHSFCKNCIQQQMNENINNCALCRKPITQLISHYLSK